MDRFNALAKANANANAMLKLAQLQYGDRFNDYAQDVYLLLKARPDFTDQDFWDAFEMVASLHEV